MSVGCSILQLQQEEHVPCVKVGDAHTIDEPTCNLITVKCIHNNICYAELFQGNLLTIRSR